MGTCQIQDVLTDASGHLHDGEQVHGWPRENSIRLKDAGGVYRVIDPDLTINQAEYQYGVAALSSGGGIWAFYLPKSTEQLPADSIWFIRMPDGKTWQGVPPSGSGPYTISDLIAAGWTLAAGGRVVSPGSDVLNTGETLLEAADFYDIVFTPKLRSDKYHPAVTLQETQGAGGVPAGGAPTAFWSNRTQNGVRINFTSTYSGILTWRCEVES